MPLLGQPLGVPSGTISIWIGLISTIPSGFVLCDGLNGTPDLRSKFPKCVPNIGTNPGAVGGAEEVTLTIANMNTHRHAFTMQNHEHDGLDDSEGSGGSPVANTPRSGERIGDFEVPMGTTHFVGPISFEGGDLPHNNIPRCKDVLYIQRL